MNTNRGTGALRMSRETLSSMNSMRAAFKAVYGKDIDVDQTMEMLFKAIAGTNPPLWEKFREMENRKQHMDSGFITKEMMLTYGRQEA